MRIRSQDLQDDAHDILLGETGGPTVRWLEDSIMDRLLAYPYCFFLIFQEYIVSIRSRFKEVSSIKDVIGLNAPLIG